MKLTGSRHLKFVFIRHSSRWVACLSSLFALAGSSLAADDRFTPPKIKVAEGFEVRLAAAPPLVGYPMMACLDDRGRLYVAESDGRNLTTRQAIERELPRFVRRLVDVDGDGVFDESTIFADRMTMPEEFVLITKQLLYFDRYAKLLAPNLNIFTDPRLIMSMMNDIVKVRQEQAQSQP